MADLQGKHVWDTSLRFKVNAFNCTKCFVSSWDVFTIRSSSRCHFVWTRCFAMFGFCWTFVLHIALCCCYTVGTAVRCGQDAAMRHNHQWCHTMCKCETASALHSVAEKQIYIVPLCPSLPVPLFVSLCWSSFLFSTPVAQFFILPYICLCPPPPSIWILLQAVEQPSARKCSSLLKQVWLTAPLAHSAVYMCVCL